MFRAPQAPPPEIARDVRAAATPLRGRADDLDPILDQVDDARIVLLGEASHGTHEYYLLRQELTKRLIEEKDFTLVTAEADWPDCSTVNRYAQGASGPHADARQALSVYERFPTWMWGNLTFMGFTEWLREHNTTRTPAQPLVGFYGLDVYSLFRSVSAVIAHLEQIDPAAARRARERYACFAPYGGDPERYAVVAAMEAESCEDDVVQMLLEILERRNELRPISPDQEYLEAEMNARVVRNAEHYYRIMMRSGAASWNVRDEHMMETLERLLDHFGPDAKAVVWAHNTHIGDARATDMQEAGYLNLGQLCRERFGDACFALGFGTWRGTVTAATAWGEPPRRMHVPEAKPHSYSGIFHETGLGDFALNTEDARDALEGTRGERAIGVVYDPRSEWGNYVPSRLAERYDAYVHVDETTHVEPLHVPTHWGWETFPSGY